MTAAALRLVRSAEAASTMRDVVDGERFATGAELHRAIMDRARSEAIALVRASSSHPAEDHEILRSIEHAVDTHGWRTAPSEQREAERVLRNASNAIDEAARVPRVAERLRNALRTVDRGLPDIDGPDPLEVLSRALAEEVRHAQPWTLLQLIVGDCADHSRGMLWDARLPTNRELALLAILAGWESSEWTPGLTVAEAIEMAVDAVRVARKGLGAGPATRGSIGRPRRTPSRNG